jgi:transcriptional regulator with XRE-family HTH domain
MSDDHDPGTPFGFDAGERLEFEQALLRESFASQIETHLEETRLPAQTLAKRMRKSKAWISKLLTGRHNPTLDTAAEVALALGLRWDIKLAVAPRAGTPAADDPPPPAWIQRPATAGAWASSHYVSSKITNIYRTNLIRTLEAETIENTLDLMWGPLFQGLFVEDDVRGHVPADEGMRWFYCGGTTYVSPPHEVIPRVEAIT